MSTPSTADVEACARRINEGRSTNHHAFIVLQAYSALLEKVADREAQLAVYDKIVPDAARIHETTAKLARVEALAPKLRKRASGPGGSSCCRDTWVLALREIATELEAALKGGEHT